MGYVDLKNEPWHLEKITLTLKKRGLAPEIDGDAWQVHGPHPGYTYQMYEGYAYFIEEPKNFMYVHITPRGVFEIDPDEKTILYNNENRIPVLSK